MEEELEDHLHDDEIEARCYHCSERCYGLCDNEDRCYTCFTHDKIDPFIDEDNWIRQLDSCMEENCTCMCHISIQETKNKKMLSRDGKKWVKIPEPEDEEARSKEVSSLLALIIAAHSQDKSNFPIPLITY